MGLMKKIGLKTNMPEITLTIEGVREPTWIERHILRRTGLVKYKRDQRANSLVRGFLDIYFGFLLGGICSAGVAASYNISDIMDITGTTRTTNINYSPYTNILGIYGAATTGIVVGTGTGAVDVTDIALETIIPHGSTGTQLLYSGMGASAPITNGTSRSFTLSRSFYNNTASTVTIKEVGIYLYEAAVWIGVASSFLLERTASTIAVTAGAGVTITYTFKITV